MSSSSWKQTLAGLKKELTRIESESRNICHQLEMPREEVEPLKIEFLQDSLEKQRKAVARQRGISSLIKDKKKVGTSLALAAGGLILGGLITKDKYAALNAGMSTFNGVLQGFGEARWVVSLGKEIVVAPVDGVSSKRIWVTLESLIGAIDHLKAEALEGKQLGALDNIIQRLQQSRNKLVYLTLPN